MNTSNTIGKIAAALLKAQRAMEAASKSATNPHFKSKYADFSAVCDAVKGPLNDNGIVFLQVPSNDSTGVQVTTMLLHESGEYLEGTIYLPVPQQTPQAYGSAITYGRRYGLQSMCGLPAEDDDGNEASKGTPRLAEAHPASGTAKREFDDLPADAQAIVREWALEVIAFVEDGKVEEAVWFIKQKCATHEDKLALWSQLPSNIRTAINKVEKERKAA